MAFPIPREAPVMSATLPFIKFVIVPIPFNFNEAVPIPINHNNVVIGAVQVAILKKKDLDGNWGNPGSH
jgi:hypothetical protein